MLAKSYHSKNFLVIMAIRVGFNVLNKMRGRCEVVFMVWEGQGGDFMSLPRASHSVHAWKFGGQRR